MAPKRQVQRIRKRQRGRSPSPLVGEVLAQSQLTIEPWITSMLAIQKVSELLAACGAEFDSCDERNWYVADKNSKRLDPDSPLGKRRRFILHMERWIDDT